jgi:hypothetical protein
MSALPARVTELPNEPVVHASPVAAQRRAERRAELKVARRARRLWAIVGCSILAGMFGLTVGILDVLH